MNVSFKRWLEVQISSFSSTYCMGDGKPRALEHQTEFSDTFSLQLRANRLESDVVVGGTSVKLYVKCGSPKHARMVFDRLVAKKLVT